MITGWSVESHGNQVSLNDSSMRDCNNQPILNLCAPFCHTKWRIQEKVKSSIRYNVFSKVHSNMK